MVTIKINTQILTGNLGDGWVDEIRAARLFADYLEGELVREAVRVFGDDAAIDVNVDLQRASGYSRPLELTAVDEDGEIIGWEYEDLFREVQHEAWGRWISTPEASNLTEQ